MLDSSILSDESLLRYLVSYFLLWNFTLNTTERTKQIPYHASRRSTVVFEANYHTLSETAEFKPTTRS